MPIEIRCKDCGTRFRIKDDFHGRSVRCRECGVFIRVPLKRPTVDEPEYVHPNEPRSTSGQGYQKPQTKRVHTEPKRRLHLKLPRPDAYRLTMTIAWSVFLFGVAIGRLGPSKNHWTHSDHPGTVRSLMSGEGRGWSGMESESVLLAKGT